jgi:hypothetical protein
MPRLLTIPAYDGDGVYDERPGQLVWLASAWQDEPVFHRTQTRGERTDCGLTVWVDRGSGIEFAGGHLLPLRHAIRFARPCGHCWP